MLKIDKILNFSNSKLVWKIENLVFSYKIVIPNMELKILQILKIEFFKNWKFSKFKIDFLITKSELKVDKIFFYNKLEFFCVYIIVNILYKYLKNIRDEFQTLN